MQALLAVDNLKIHFPIKKGLFARTIGHVYAVDGVSLCLARGETLGLVGESGCGKTTTGLAILRLLDPTAGRIVFDGRDITQMTRNQMRPLRKQLQIIFQDPYSSLNPRMTVNEILADPLRVHSLHQGAGRQEWIDFILEKVGLSPEHGRRYPHEFSGGQRQRVGIARALALSPRLIVGDEPVSALDVSIQAQIINLLIDLQAEFDLSYIIIAHDLAVVEHMCDRVAVMYLGKIVESGPYDQVYNNPLHPYTQALLSAIPVPDPTRTRQRTVLQGDVPSPIEPPGGCHFHPRCPRVKKGCGRHMPELKEHRPDHWVRCWLY